LVTHTPEGSRTTAASEASYRQIVTTCQEGVWVIDSARATVFVNPQLAALLGYAAEEMLGRPVADFLQPSEQERAARALARVRDGEHGRVELPLRRRDESEVWALLSLSALKDETGGRVGVLALVTDLTDRRQLESKIQQAQKLESLAKLAGGIAHEFNNLLVGILGNVDMVLRDNPEAWASRPLLEEVRASALRAAELTMQMLAYSGKGRLLVESIDLSRLVQETVPLLAAAISKKARLELDLSGELPTIEADGAQLRQILLNLVTNASEALAAGSGVIRLASGLLQADRSYLGTTYLDEGLPAGRYVYLDVSDDGGGMNSDTIPRIFEPFFTTKFTGRGLGLAAVLGILRGHRGAIKVETRPGHGSTFRILLPAPAPKHAAAQSPAVSAPPSAHSRTVLVADDEPTVRNVAGRILERSGYELVFASNGRQAVELYGKYADEIACVLLDLTMPELDGVQVFEEIRRIRSDVRVILSTGYGEHDAAARLVGIAGFLHKPWLPADLLAAVNKALQR